VNVFRNILGKLGLDSSTNNFVLTYALAASVHFCEPGFTGRYEDLRDKDHEVIYSSLNPQEPELHTA
jgi:hypothetical protein